MASAAKHLRDHIDDQLEQLSTLEELSDERYHASHETFEGASNQRALILAWLDRLADRLGLRGARHLDLLSVGCGGGVMDRRVAHVFADRVETVSLVGVDPNPEHTQAFKDQLAGEGFDAEAFTSGFEDFETDQAFDVVHFIHCLYYFEHFEPELHKAVGMLKPGGALVVLQAPNEALNHLADRVWKKQFERSAWYSDDIVGALERMNIELQIERLEADLDVTDCFVNGNQSGREILDFIVQAETRKLSGTLQASLLESLRSISRQEKGRMLCRHPVDAIVAYKRK